MSQSIKIADLTIEEDHSFFVIAGPCVIENEALTLEIARFLKEASETLEVPIIFKTSYDKANRTSLQSFRGPGIDVGLEIIQKVKDTTGLPVLSDVHRICEVERAARILDVIQIPAFLCRQTDLVIAVARTGVPVNIKKGQFISPWEIKQVVEKITSTGNHNVLITERGTFFGYNNLVVDMRAIAIMKGFGFPVVFDATHSVQLPGAAGSASSGQREFIRPLARAAVAAGASGVFMEVHPEPDAALCDGPNSLPLDGFRSLLSMLKQIHEVISSPR